MDRQAKPMGYAVRNFATWFNVAIAGFAIASPGTALAQEGVYGSVSVSVPIDKTAEISSSGPFGGTAVLEDTYSGEIAIGYRWASGWRVEVEGSHFNADIAGGPLIDPGGSIKGSGLMVGLVKEFGNRPIRPYMSAAAGPYRVKIDATYSPPLNPVTLSDRHTALGLKLGAGVAVRLSSRIDLDIGYRYFDMSGYEGVGRSPPANRVPVSANFSTHSATAGLRITF